MRVWTLILAIVFAATSALADERTVTIIHFSDYHAHAVPFYANGEPRSAGIARAIEWLEPRAADPSTLVFSGGDMLNLGAPPWSDKYGCVDWAWFNGIVDAMAYGNHDADYGPAAFAACREQIDYPVLGANVISRSGEPLFLAHGKPYAVFERGGARVGVFAVTGDEFENLVSAARRPSEGARFTERIGTARTIVETLRTAEKVDLVVLIGHAQKEEDLALARAVPGIDLILGTHSHRLEPVEKIDGTATWIVSPGQYLTSIARIAITLRDDGSRGVTGELVPMLRSLPEDRATARRIRKMDRALRRDPKFAPLYKTIGRAAAEFSTAGSSERDSSLGNFVTDMMRVRSGADVALSTASSFREPIPPGKVRGVDLLAALPYENEILVYELSGEQLRSVLDYSASRRGSDFFAQLSGLRMRMASGGIAAVEIADAGGWTPLDPAKRYTVATTNYLALVASGYRDLFSPLQPRSTGIKVRAEIERMFREGKALRPPTDRRIND